MKNAIISNISSFGFLIAFIYLSHAQMNHVRFSLMQDKLQEIINESKCAVHMVHYMTHSKLRNEYLLFRLCYPVELNNWKFH